MAGDDDQPGGEWISIDDFSMGIYEDWAANSGGGSTLIRNGAATKTNTFRCYADPNTGALTPLPRAVAGTTDSPFGTISTSFYPTGQVGMYVLDALVKGGLILSPAGVLYPSNPDACYVMYGAYYDNDGGSNSYRGYTLGREYNLLSASKADFQFTRDSVTVAAPKFLPPGSLDLTLYDASYAGTGFLVVAANSCLLFTGKAQASPQTGAIAAADQLLTTFDTDVSANYSAGNAFVTRGGAGALLNSQIAVLAGAGVTAPFNYLLAHQGRILGMGAGPGDGAGNAWNPTNASIRDIIAFSAVRTLGTVSAGSTFMEENQSGMGAIVSLTADQLLIVKHYGGGYIIRGSITAPTITRLPFLQSTEGVASRPAATPLGAVYGTRTGVYAYNGGDTSVYLSPQLNGLFWRSAQAPSTEQYAGIESRFDWWDPYVCVGNNWLLDSRTKAWWRLDDPTLNNARPFSHYSVSSSTGKLYAFHYKLSAATQPVWQLFDRTLLALSYSWQSQPLIETARDYYEYQDIELIAMRPASASGTCTLTVTLTGVSQTGATLASRVLTIDLASTTADQPAVIRYPITDGVNGSFRARYVQVRIEATSSTGAAPKVFPGFRIWRRNQSSTPRWV